MKKTFLFFIGIALLAHLSPLYADDPVVRVRIMYTKSTVNLTIESKITVTNQADDKIILRGNRSFAITCDDSLLHLIDDKSRPLISGTVLTIDNPDKNKDIGILAVPFGIGWSWQGEEDRTYRGNLEFYINADHAIDVISVLDLETYLLGVVPAEIGVDSPMDALKAQAICARSEAIVGLETGKYAGEHYTLTADIYCQVYSGIGMANDAIRKAVAETRGEVLTADDTVISAYYSSNCGGYSENIENVWPERSGHKEYWSGHPDMDSTISLDLTQADDIRTWINSTPDSWCKPSEQTPEWSWGNFRWSRSITPEELSQLVSDKVSDIGMIYDIIPLERGISGRIKDILFVGDRGHCRLTGELAIRMIWNPPLKSSCFIVDKIGPVEHPVSFIITGAGWGHGVGMCQTGAIAQANNGRTYRDILAFYFRGSKIKQYYK